MRWFRAVAVVIALAGVLACESDEARLAEHLERGEAYLSEDKASEAVIEYKNALQLAPNEAAAHYGLARAYMAIKQPRKAFWEYQETARLDPSNHDARLAYAQFLLFGGDDELTQALEQADAVIAADETRWEAHLMRGRSLEGLSRIDEAQAAYEKASELQPERSELIRLLANFQVRQGRTEAAEALYQNLVEVAPTTESYFALGGFLAQARERDEEAEAAYRNAIEVAEDAERSAAYRRLGSFYYSRERFDEAEAILREGLEATGDDIELIYSLARYYHSRGAPEKADAMMEEATRARPDEVRPYLILSAYRGRAGDLEGALEAAEAALSVDGNDESARLRKAELLVDLGIRRGESERLAEGRAIVQAILASSPDSPEGHFVGAKLDLAEGRPDDATVALRKALDVRPDWPQAHFLLASALVLEGDRQQARAEALRSVELDADFVEARRLLTRIHAELGEHDLAVEEARRILRQNPDDRAMRIVMAQSLVHLGKLDQARAELESVPLEDRASEVHFALARIDMMQGRNEFARAKLLAALEERPEHPEILESLLRVEASLGQIDRFLQRIAEAAESRPDKASLVRLHGLALLLAKQGREGEAKLRRAIELDPNDLAAYQALAQLLMSTRRVEESIQTYQRAVESRPDSAPLRFTLGTLLEGSGRAEEAIEQYEAAIAVDPRLAVAKNNLAYLLAEGGNDLDRALDLAQEAKRELPDNPNSADTLGWVLYKKGIPEAAVGYLREAEAGFPPDHRDLGVVRYHLALAYEAQGEPSQARETLERALQQLEKARAAAAEAGNPEPADPPWVADVRNLLNRLGE